METSVYVDGLDSQINCKTSPKKTSYVFFKTKYLNDQEWLKNTQVCEVHT